MTSMPRAPLGKVRVRGFAAPVLASVVLAVAPARAPAQEVRYTRPVEVAEPGWVRVPLASAVVRRAGPGGGIRLFEPDGRELPFARLPVDAAPSRRAAGPMPPEPAEDGWWIPLEVAPGPRLHELLVLSLEEPEPGEPPPEVRLEGSEDGDSWHLLSAGEARLEGETLTFAYPATELRRLRLHWPRGSGGSGPPVLTAAAVEEVPSGAFGVSVARPDCRATEASAAPPGTVCRLRLGGTGRYLRRLCFTVGSDGPAGYRLFSAVDGRWEPLAEAAWKTAPEAAPRCALLDLTLAGELEPLRLELYGGGEESPEVRDAAAGFAPEMLVFEARRAGVHTLAYGPGVVRSALEGEVEPPAAAPAQVAVPGAEETGGVPVSTPALPTDAGPAPAVWFEESWDLTAEAPEPGQLHRLELPDVVYSVSEAELADLRLLVAGAGSRLQVPYALWRPDEPTAVAERRGASPRRREGDVTSRVGMEPGGPGLPLSALVVSAAPPAARSADGEVWARRVRVREPAPVDLGEERVGPWVDWRCRPLPPLPCRVTVPLEAPAVGVLVVEIDDGGAAPLAAVDLELWRRRDVLLFPWPAEGTTPVLAAGAAELEAPELDLAARVEELVARPSREAVLAVESAGGGRLGAVAITFTLIGAAALLLVLLHRTLVEQDRGRR